MLHLESHEDFKNTDIWEPHTHPEILVELVWGASKTFGFEKLSWWFQRPAHFENQWTKLITPPTK